MYTITRNQFCQVVLKIDIPKSEVCNANVNIGTASSSKALTLNHIFQGQGFCKFTEIHKGLRGLSDKLNLNCLITLNENFCLKIYLGSCCNSHHTWATSLPDPPIFILIPYLSLHTPGCLLLQLPNTRYLFIMFPLKLQKLNL